MLLSSQRLLAPSRALRRHKEGFNKIMRKLIGKQLSNTLAENKLKINQNYELPLVFPSTVCLFSPHIWNKPYFY